jgi:hypothetical protein
MKNYFYLPFQLNFVTAEIGHWFFCAGRDQEMGGLELFGHPVRNEYQYANDLLTKLDSIFTSRAVVLQSSCSRPPS